MPPMVADLTGLRLTRPAPLLADGHAVRLVLAVLALALLIAAAACAALP
jgi:hypothetical protein